MHDIQHYSILKNYFTVLYIDICISAYYIVLSKYFRRCILG